MDLFTTVQRKEAFVWLSLFHLLAITSSNYLTQLPISIFDFYTTWGTFSLPFTFLVTGLTAHIFDAPLAWRIIFVMMVPTLVISYGISALLYTDEWQGFAVLGTFNLFITRIAITSFTTYALGRILGVHVFNRLRQSHHWWLASTASALFGNINDIVAFFSIAFWRSLDPFIATHWGEIALVDYSFKMLISIISLLPMYGVLLNTLLKKLADRSDLSALQPN